MSCNQTTNTPINQEEDPCNGIKKSTECVTEPNALTELGTIAGASQNEINLAIQTAIYNISLLATLQAYTVETLPSNPTKLLAYVTDADSPSYRQAVVGGGDERTLVFHNGTTWICH